MKYIVEQESSARIEIHGYECDDCGNTQEYEWQEYEWECEDCGSENICEFEDSGECAGEFFLHQINIEQEGPEFNKYNDGSAAIATTASSISVLARGSRFFTQVEWTTNRELTLEEMKELNSYTQGQMSDGIGEGFKQYPCNQEGNLYFSMWKSGCDSKIWRVEQ